MPPAGADVLLQPGTLKGSTSCVSLLKADGGSEVTRSEQPADSALPVPAPDRSVVTHGDQNAAVAAEARLADGRGAFRERERRAPGDGEHSIR